MTALYQILTESRHRDRRFLSIPDGDSWTYGGVDDLASRIGAVLIAAGVTPGERVMAHTEKSPETVALYLAALRIGAVFVPLNPAYTPDEVSFYLTDARPKMFVTDQANAVDATSETAVLIFTGPGSLIEAAANAPSTPPVARSSDDPAAMLYTSGTTGRPKGAVLTNANLTSNAITLHDAWGFHTDDVLLHMLPIFHVHGLFVALHCAMLAGSEVIFLPRFNVDYVIENLPASTVLMGVPTQYGRLLDDPRFDSRLCAGVRLFTSGSAPMTPQVHAAFQERTGQVILERYGMTETGMITSNPYRGDRVAGTVGMALPGIEVRVVDPTGGACTPGVTGAVEVRGPNVFDRYWDQPEKTEEVFRDEGWFITGDLGALDESGRLTLTGRSTDMIISGGLNVHPIEIESVLDDVPGVVESAVVGLPHQDLGEAVAAFIVCSEPVDGSVLEEHLARLARFKHPKGVIEVESLPRNAMGKIQKSVLRREHVALFDSPAPRG